jgi:ELWxxDGT repeat protein
MKKPLSRQLCNSMRTAKHLGRVSRAKSRQRPLRFEALEGRAMLSLTAQMVLDINAANTYSSEPYEITAVGSSTFFTADDGVHGIELWTSDGTAAGTTLVKDIFPGIGNNFTRPGWLTNVNGTLFFTADNGTHGWELWRSDGTAAGTSVVKDIYPGINSSGPGPLTNVNGTLYFSADDGVHGPELWKSDGTAAGTVLVKDSSPGSLYSDARPHELVNVNGTLFFSTRDYYTTGGSNGSELWKSDGTADDTVRIKEFYRDTNGQNPVNLTDVNGTLFFVANDGVSGFELWKSDGTTAGTTLVKDLIPGGGSAFLDSLININGTLFFTVDDGTTGRELWKSDGTAAGTVLVKDIYPSNTFLDAAPASLRNVNGTLFFTVGDGAHGRELWKSDGTAAGTVLVKDINPGTNGSYPGSLTNVNGTLYFSAGDGAHGAELWKSDGTAAGTILVDDSLPGNGGISPWRLTNVNGTLFFAAHDSKGSELWKSDGTATGTNLVKDINIRNFSSYPESMTDVNGTLFFTADNGVHGNELWKSDGTVAGTTLVKDIFPGGYIGYYGGYYPQSSSPGNLTNVNGTLFFTAWNGQQLWKSDGTEAGTVLVRQMTAFNLTDVNGTLFFVADDGMNGMELWKSDGTTAGTTLVKDIHPGQSRYYDYYGNWTYPWYVPNSSSPSFLTSLNGTLYFVAEDGVHGWEVWKSDGTAAGTMLVKDIYPGTGNGAGGLTRLTVADDRLYLTAHDGVHGAELWTSDGTSAGTVIVKDILPGSIGSYPHSQANADGTLFFSANDGTHGHELWKSDGTAAGTTLVKDIYAGSAHSYPEPGGRIYTYAPLEPGASLNGVLFFTANDGVHGRELWKSDGTAAGTMLVKDIYPGTDGNYSAPKDLTSVNGKLFFTDYESRLWQNDGTEAGTVRVVDQFTNDLTNVTGTLFFTSYDGIHGTELWMLVEDDLPSLTIGDVSVTEGHTGTQSATFTVTLSAASTLPVTVNYATADSSAMAGSDYVPASGMLTFTPGETSKAITVLVNGDGLVEPNEVFLVNLSTPASATIADGQGVGTIGTTSRLSASATWR